MPMTMMSNSCKQRLKSYRQKMKHVSVRLMGWSAKLKYRKM